VATAAAAGGVVAAVRSAVAIPETQKQYEPAPPGRSKKRKVAAAATAAEEMVRLGEEVERTSERLHRGHRPVKLSTEDKAPSIELDKDQRTATSTKGYKMVSTSFVCPSVHACMLVSDVPTSPGFSPFPSGARNPWGPRGHVVL